MYIRWQHRRRKFWNGETTTHWSAILVESKRVNGKPRQHHIAHIVGFDENPINEYRVWDTVDACLDRLANQITPAEREQIEAGIAKKVPRPTPEEYKKGAEMPQSLRDIVNPSPRCSFCGKADVIMVHADGGYYARICSACVDEAASIVAKMRQSKLVEHSAD
jgi:hypothetical protein